MKLSETFLTDLRLRCDIESIAAGYVALKQRGSVMVGLCPFHNEKTPSFTLYPENGSFYCFGCGAGGDVITFIRKIENLEYMEAVRLLAEKAGLRMPDAEADATEQLRTQILSANREAARFFHTQLTGKNGQAGLNYLTNRRLSPETIRRFGLGFAPNSWNSLYTHLKTKGFGDEILLAARLVNKGKKGGCYDAFRNRVIFPIINIRGHVIAFGGRVLDNALPKYLNSADTLVFKKSRELFGFNLAKKNAAEGLILAEGYMDVISLHQAGFSNAVATLGTSLTVEQARIMARYTKSATICYDSDAAGQKAAARAIDILNTAGLNVKVLKITDGKDPDDFIKTHGPEKFRMLLEGAENDIEYRLLKLRDQSDLSASSGKVAFLEGAAGILASLDSPIERDIYSAKLSSELGVDKRAMDARITDIFREMQQKQERRELAAITAPPGKPDKINPEKRLHKRAALAEEGLIAILWRHPDLYEYVNSAISPADFITPFNERVYAALAERLESGGNIDLILFSDIFSPEELGRIVSIQTRESTRAGTKVECNLCINIILEEKAKLAKTPAADMATDEWNTYLRELQKKKLTR